MKLSIADKIRDNFDSMSDVYDFIHVFILINVVSILLKLLTVKKILLLLTPGIQSSPVTTNKIGKIVRYTDFLMNISFLYFDNNCLKRSLVLFYILRKMGINVSFKIGVKKSDRDSGYNLKNLAKIDGHAWLSLNDEVYLEKEPELTKTYTVVFSYSGSADKC